MPLRKSDDDLLPKPPATEQLSDTSAAAQSEGQQKNYTVIAQRDRNPDEFVRPVRQAYVHIGKYKGTEFIECGTVTTMSRSIAETYARDPSFYSDTYCCGCKDHFPIGKDGLFVWMHPSGRRDWIKDENNNAIPWKVGT